MMLPSVKRVIKVLAIDMERFENDAKRIDAMIPKLPADEREAWKETAKGYRERSAQYRANIEAIKAELKAGDFIKPDPASVR
jgi:succinate dehydrogenase/fumarate reductase-like Fe-S protein